MYSAPRLPMSSSSVTPLSVFRMSSRIRPRLTARMWVTTSRGSSRTALPRFPRLAVLAVKRRWFSILGFEVGGPSAGLYANKWMPSASDTVAKVIGTHTVKGGFYWEWIRNDQPANNNTNGELQFVSSGNPYTTGDSYADEVLGILSSYNETSFNRVNDIAYNTYEGFAQDDWKVTKRFTLDFGLRFSHFQPWGDRLGDGF